MPVGYVCGRDAQDLPGHDLAAEEHQDPVHGTHELGLARTPAHASRNRQRVERGLHDAGQEAHRVGAGLDRPVDDPHALGRLEALE
jgi:hypothetical protein